MDLWFHQSNEQTKAEVLRIHIDKRDDTRLDRSRSLHGLRLSTTAYETFWRRPFGQHSSFVFLWPRLPLRQSSTDTHREMENRLPFMFIHLPQNFNKEYEENLRQNQNRLTTSFDIHATLTHLVQGNISLYNPSPWKIGEILNNTIRQKVSILVPQNLLATQTVNNVDRF